MLVDMSKCDCTCKCIHIMLFTIKINHTFVLIDTSIYDAKHVTMLLESKSWYNVKRCNIDIHTLDGLLDTFG